MPKIAVLASGSGTGLQSIIDQIKAGNMPGIELALVVGDKEDAYALQRAKEQNYEALFINPKNKTREEFDQEIAKVLESHNIDLIILFGYMRILTPGFVQNFPRKILNVHPALIPKYCGENFYGDKVHKAVLAAGEKESGMTIHYVDEGVDTGEIILQKTCPIEADDTLESLKARVQALERKYYPEVIRQLLTE